MYSLCNVAFYVGTEYEVQDIFVINILYLWWKVFEHQQPLSHTQNMIAKETKLVFTRITPFSLFNIRSSCIYKTKLLN